MLSEFERIARFTKPFESGGASVIAGPGDDCAITQPRAGWVLVSKVDHVVEGVHFGPAFLPEEIGHKALAVSLSDLAAAGAEPRWFLVAVAMPDRYPIDRLDGIARGMSLLAARAKIALVGGNFTTASELSLAVTALGEAPKGQALRRSGASPGDWLLLSGTVGDAALGLERLASGRPAELDASVLAQLRPEPRLELGKILGAYASAAVDVSDGLVQDLGHLCTRSGVGADVELPSLPLGEGVRGLGERGLRLALAGGEDYELLCAVPPDRAPPLLERAAALGQPLRRIGTCTEGPGIRLLDEEGRAMPLEGLSGWEHFR